MRSFAALFVMFLLPFCFINATPMSPISATLQRRTDPVFPDDVPSCPICAKDYSSINSCAQAAPVLANFTMIIFNPGAFIDVIKCACADTFQAVYPQCVDCFIKTDQQNVLNTTDLPSVVDGMRKICALQSTLFGNVSGADNGSSIQSVSGELSMEIHYPLFVAFGLISFAITYLW